VDPDCTASGMRIEKNAFSFQRICLKDVAMFGVAPYLFGLVNSDLFLVTLLQYEDDSLLGHCAVWSRRS
jgi:hypothetical protein